VSAIFFDTNIIIDALARRPQALAELRRATRPWISRVTWIEILAGVPPPARTETESYLSHFSIRELSPEIARRAADLRFNRRSIKLPDAIIFASAQEQGAILVTRNAKDFPATMPGIRIPYSLPSKA
jgi:predicted nucleic acid-binding protein